MSFSRFINGSPGMQFLQHTAKRYPLGQVMIFEDGRMFRYVENGATLAVAGSLYQSEVPPAADDAMAIPTAVAAGARSLNITLNGDASTLNEFAEGYLNIEDDAGEGRAYQIATNAAAAASAAMAVTLREGVDEAMTTATTVGIFKNPFKDIIIHPSPPTAAIVGVACADIAANAFGWVQTHGPCSVLTIGTLVIGSLVVPSNTTNGGVEDADQLITDGTPPTGHGLAVPVGVCMAVEATTEHSMIYLTID